MKSSAATIKQLAAHICIRKYPLVSLNLLPGADMIAAAIGGLIRQPMPSLTIRISTYFSVKNGEARFVTNSPLNIPNLVLTTAGEGIRRGTTAANNADIIPEQYPKATAQVIVPAVEVTAAQQKAMMALAKVEQVNISTMPNLSATAVAVNRAIRLAPFAITKM